VLYTSGKFLRKYGIGNTGMLVILILLVTVTPLPPLMFTGLEHVFHIWVSLLFIYYVAEDLPAEKTNSRTFCLILILSAILPTIRYESIFIILISVFLFAVKGKWLKSFSMLVTSFIPILVFGVISIKAGWSFFPNSLLLKASFPDVTSLNEFFNFIWFVICTIISIKILVIFSAFLIVLIVLAFKFKSVIASLFSTSISYTILLFSANVLLYAAYSRSGWSYRYQSFLVAIGIVVFGIVTFKYLVPAIKKKISAKIVIPFLIFIAAGVCFLISGIYLMLNTPRATVNIYEQQYQMSVFLDKYYTNKGIALNDIGACNYFAEIKCLDLWGLANLEISKQRRKNIFDVKTIETAVKKYDVEIAIIYDSWFIEGDSTSIPVYWLKAGEWKINNNIIAGDDNISFYATDKKYFEDLVSRLKDFSGNLPKGVVEEGYYINK
jgi:hypothetical protein